MEQLVKGFIESRIANGASSKTILLCRSHIKLFLDWLSAQNISDPDGITKEVMTSYAAFLHTRKNLHPSFNQPLQKSSIRKHIQMLLRLGEYLESIGFQNVSSHLIPPHPAVREIPSLDDGQISFLFEVVGHLKMAKQYRALFTLLLDTGLRINEALNLQVHHIDLMKMQVNVIGKNDKQRTVPLSLHTKVLLTELIPAGGGHIFRTHWGKLTDSTVRDVLGKIKKNNPSVFVGIRLSPHTLRHSFARHWVNSGGDIYSLMRILGHSDIKMTEKYLYLNNNDLKVKHSKHSPFGS